jgi:hypothetical protein
MAPQTTQQLRELTFHTVIAPSLEDVASVGHQSVVFTPSGHAFVRPKKRQVGKRVSSRSQGVPWQQSGQELLFAALLLKRPACQ